MSDYSDKGSSDSEDMGSQRSSTPDRSSSGITHQQTQQAKTCADCGTTKTPLWRGGPAGPKSLCNACGIRSRKKRRALLGINSKGKDSKEEKKIKKLSKKNNNDGNNSGESTSTSADSTSMVGVYGDAFEGGKLFLFGRGSDVALQRPRSKTNSKSQRKKSGEEEQAAFLLMSLSRGCVYS